MENLLNSRMSRDQSPSKLENLSPQKFGKGAYANLSYTPSKLADNILFKEVTTLKKMEQGSSKIRESSAFNNLLKDRLNQLIEQRDGIQKSLTQQIVMYKKMLHENEIKNEKRLKDIQDNFNNEMQKIIEDKQQEVKYAQSEKQLLENRIFQLENMVSELRQQLTQGNGNFENLTKQHQKLQIHFNNMEQKLADTDKRWKQDNEKNKSQIQGLNRKIYNNQVEFKGKIDQLNLQREKQKENLERLHRTELEKVENQRINQAIMKNQQLKDLTSTFQSQANRLKDIIENKEKNIQSLTHNVSDLKQKILEITRQYTGEISNLVHQKGRFKEEVDQLNYENTKLDEELKQTRLDFSRKQASLESYIAKLKEEIEISQINSIKDRDRTGYAFEDMTRQIHHLKFENEKVSALQGQNNVLCRQVRNLKDLLLESSLQMQRCKDEFLRMGRQKDHLMIKLKQMGVENETLVRIKVDRQEEARGWRQTYYMNRR